uniref:ATP synthase subunit a n=1 Tax=Monomorium pharaonis TaxID=307658 RepID=A0A7L8EZ02_MONPH|nr:ATP synthase F0 subunit 6 [Monomorium pharaonis]QOE17533.1 ATP synthase F0 subunit 6 [Monomorium pharaonis]
MMNIFSIFDPSTSTLLSLNWMSMILMFYIMPFQFWLIPSRLTIIWMNIIKFMFNELKILINYSFSNIILFIALLLLIFFNNFLGLFPYIFTTSSHMNFCLSLSLTFWLGMMIYSMFNYMNDLLTHLTPMGTPPILMPFMVIIESISLLIRPITLSIRLTANMIAGHLLLSLLGSSGEIITNIFILNLMLMSQILLFMLEIFVSLIQAYVFAILSTLYSSEI